MERASSYEIEYRASSDDRLVTLPSAAQHDELVEVSLWGDSDRRLEALWMQHAGQAHSSAWGRSVRLPLVLVHRGDNRYNTNAISVSTPARADVPVEQRHLGYLYDDYLERVGEFALPDLIGFAGGQVWCTAYIEYAFAAKAEWLWVALPDPELLGHSVRDFLRSHGGPDDTGFESLASVRPGKSAPRRLRGSGQDSDGSAQAPRSTGQPPKPRARPPHKC